MTNLHDEVEKKLQDSNATPIFLPLQFLEVITRNFSPELEIGRGGFGVVYKGTLQSGKIIAVKKIFDIHLVDDTTFQNEVSSLMEIRHQHVVRFIGYCAESSFERIEREKGDFIWAEIPKRLLCFEYLCHASLDKYISVPTDPSSVLEWNMRFEIIKGICNGLNFLHEKCGMVHLDLKLQNILMDATMMPKIADFGLSRIFGNQQSQIVTKNSIGSCGYMAPEYIDQGIISMKADIFSLGVMIIEIMTGKRDYPYFYLDSPESTATSCLQFTEQVRGSWRYKFESAENCKSAGIYNQQVEQCVAIALKCVDPRRERRPTAKGVIQVLNAVRQEAPLPTSSSEGKRRNAPFKSRVELDPHYVELDPHYVHKICKKMTEAIHQFYVGDLSKIVSWEELYRCGYILVVHKQGELLYSAVEMAMASEVQDFGRTLDTIASGNRVPLLQELLARWYRHSTANACACDVLMYMDRTFVQNNRKASVREMGLRLFRDGVVRSNKTLPRLIKAMRPERQSRDREEVPDHLIASVTYMLKKLGDEVYQEVMGVPPPTE